MTSIKICGLSKSATLHTAVEAGAHMVGFVHFEKSPRHVSLARAAELQALLPDNVKSVLVVVDPDDLLLKKIITILLPAYIQLHGHETPERVAAIRKEYPQQKLIKALAVAVASDLNAARGFEPYVDMLLFDAKPNSSTRRGEAGRGAFLLGANNANSEQASPHPNPPPVGEGSYLPGGNGVAFDWSIMQGFESPRPWILSGGLTTENVATAIAQSGAKIVDVSSGVESAPGVKEDTKIREFISCAQQK